jgi:hypothetical protein
LPGPVARHCEGIHLFAATATAVFRRRRLTAELGHFVSALTLKDIPLEAQAVAKTGFTDCFGVMVAGARDPVVALLDREMAGSDSKAQASLVPSLKKRNVEDAALVNRAGLTTANGNVTPHTFRHTAATWLMQAGVPVWTAAGYLGMSVEVLINTYGHHHPDHLREAANAFGRKARRDVSVVETVVGRSIDRRKIQKPRKSLVAAAVVIEPVSAS